MVKPATFTVKLPFVANGEVTESTTPKPPRVGAGKVLNTTPLAVIVALPLLTIVPAKVAWLVVILVFVPVSIVGATGEKTSILSKAQPSDVPEPSEAKRILNLTLPWPAAPVN